MLVTAAGLGLSYGIAYWRASRAGQALPASRALPSGEYYFARITGRPGTDERWHRTATWIFAPAWRLELALDGPEPTRPAPDDPSFEILGFGVRLGHDTPITARQARHLEEWWAAHDPPSLVAPDVAPRPDVASSPGARRPRGHRAMASGPCVVRLRARRDTEAVNLEWPCGATWSEAADERRLWDAVRALHRALGPAG